MPLIRKNATTVAPMLSGRRDSCLRSVPVSSKYIDLPENPELQSGHLNRADRELSRGSPFTPQFPIRHPVFSAFTLPHISASERRQLYCLLECGLLSSFSTMPKRSSELRQSLGSGPPCLGLQYRRRGFRMLRFLHGMEEAFSLSPFFGIPLLKRLSCMSKSLLPPSRNTFKPHVRTIVKPDF
jgi:hypothetical protein